MLIDSNSGAILGEHPYLLDVIRENGLQPTAVRLCRADRALGEKGWGPEMPGTWFYVLNRAGRESGRVGHTDAFISPEGILEVWLLVVYILKYRMLPRKEGWTFNETVVASILRMRRRRPGKVVEYRYESKTLILHLPQRGRSLFRSVTE